MNSALANLAETLHEFSAFAYFASWFMALGLVGLAGRALYMHAHDPIRYPLTGIGLTFISATGLAALGTSVSVLESTVFGPGQTSTLLSYQPHGDGDISRQFSDAVFVAQMFMQFVGYIAVIRGFLMLRRMHESDKTANDAGWRVWMHLFGGAACTNIAATGAFFAWLFNVSFSF